LRRLHGGSRTELKRRRRRDRELTARRSTLARSANHDWTAGASNWRRAEQARKRPSPAALWCQELALRDAAKRYRDGDGEARRTEETVLLLAAAETGAVGVQCAA
jgi:hypothetical protein